MLLSTKNLPLATAYPKVSPEWAGPFRISMCYPQTQNYILDLPAAMAKIHPTFHVEPIKKYIPNDDVKFPARMNTEPGPLPEFKDDKVY